MLTKVAHLQPVKKEHTSKDIVQIFMHTIFVYHKLPRKIILDCDSKFIGNFWKAIFEATSTQLSYSTTYHPQIDRHIERVNQVIEDMLHVYCRREPKHWIRYLHLVEFACNASH